LLLELILLVLLLEARGEAEIDEAVGAISRDGGFGIGVFEAGAASKTVDGEEEGAFTG
jgi:hypothetical protein